MFAAGVCPVFGQLDPTDPWPKFGHDVRNTCWVGPPNAGPGQKPYWKWWARVKIADVGQDAHVRGPAIAYFTSATTPGPLLLVGTRGGAGTPAKVLVFKSSYTLAELDPQNGAAPVVSFIVSAPVNSTPLILPDDRVVIQTESTLELWDLGNVASPVRRWVTAATTPFRSAGSSPTYGPLVPNGVDQYIFAQANAALYCIHPDQPPGEIDPDSAALWVRPLGAPDGGKQSPALGPSASGQDNLLYVSRVQGLEDALANYFYAVLGADGSLSWEAGLYPWFGMKIGTFSSPTVHHASAGAVANQVIFPADDGGLYAFANVVVMPPTRRWTDYFGGYRPPQGIDCISATAGATPDGQLLFWTEGTSLWHIQDLESTWQRLSFERGGAMCGGWIMGAPVVDAYRVYIPGSDDNLVFGLDYPFTGQYWQWGEAGDLPPNALSDPFSSPLALLDNGWLVCLSHRFLYVLAPPDSELNGDGLGDNYDVDGLALALDDPKAWETRYGGIFGINRLGGADANRDWKVDGKDIDPLATKMIANFRGGQAEWDYFCRTIDVLKARHP